MLKLEGVIGDNCSLAHLTACLRAGGLDITAPADLLKRHLKEHLPRSIELPANVEKTADSVSATNGTDNVVGGKVKDKVVIRNGQKPVGVGESADIMDITTGVDPVDAGKGKDVGVGQPRGTEGKNNRKSKKARGKQTALTNSNLPGNIGGQGSVQDDEMAQTLVPHGQPEGSYMIRASRNPDAWRSKIWLSAYECENENPTLPTPDFPFQQQQLQMNPGKKRKRKNQRQEQSTAHTDSLEQPDVAILNYDEPEQPSEHPTTEKDISTEEDLPSLPADISSLAALTQPLVCGTVIAFKRLDMDPRTYVPILTDYLTATIEKVHTDVQDGPQLELRLAIRDRPKPQFDKRTGEKILGRFAMPGLEDEVEEGLVYLMWGEFLEPKVVRLPERGTEPVEEPMDESVVESVQLQKSPSNGESRQAAMVKESGLKRDVGQDSLELNYGDDIYMENNRTQESAKEHPQSPPQDDDDDGLTAALNGFDCEEGNQDVNIVDEIPIVDERVDEADDEVDSPPASPPAEEAEVTHNGLRAQASDKEVDSPAGGGEEDRRLIEAEKAMTPTPEEGEATSLAMVASCSPAVEDDSPKLKTEGGGAPSLDLFPSTTRPSPRAAKRGPAAPTTFIVISDDEDSDPGPPLNELFSQQSLFSPSQGVTSLPKNGGSSTSVPQYFPPPSSAPLPSSPPQRQLHSEASQPSPEMTPAKKHQERKSKVGTPPGEGSARRIFRDSVPNTPTGSQQLRPDNVNHGSPQGSPENSTSTPNKFSPIPGNWAALRAVNTEKEK